MYDFFELAQNQDFRKQWFIKTNSIWHHFRNGDPPKAPYNLRLQVKWLYFLSMFF